MNTDDLKNIIRKIREKVINQIEKEEFESKQPVSNERLKEIIELNLKDYARENGIHFTLQIRKQISEDVFNGIRGLGILQGLIEDPQITEIMVNGPDTIFIEKNGRLTEYDRRFESEEELMRIVKTIVEKVNREINPSDPIADARLEDGSRVSAVVKPVALNGPILTIRKFPETPMTIEQLIKWKSITGEVAEFLETLVKAKYNIFVCGGTGSGKTTFLNALSNFIPKDERIITIEDSAELQIRNVKNLVRLETKEANVEGKGQITIRDLIKASLRMRPDRIVVGEVRGAEALDMLQAMNTGHDGSLSTGHANSSRDILTRLETMVLTGADFPLDAIRQQIASALDIIVHLGRLRDKSRKVLEVTEVLGYENGMIQLNPLYQFKDYGDGPDGKVKGELLHTGNKLVNRIKLAMSGMKYTGNVI
jgi:pilus assembly protein CpaF